MKVTMFKMVVLVMLSITMPVSLSFASEKPVTLWQFETQSSLLQVQTSLNLPAPLHSSNHTALRLAPFKTASLQPDNLLQIAVPMHHHPLQLTIVEIKQQYGQTIVYASDTEQRLILTTDVEYIFATVITERGVWSISGKGTEALMYRTHDSSHNHFNTEDDFIIAPELPLVKTKKPLQQPTTTDINSDTIAVVDAYILYNHAAEQLYGSNAGVLTRINHIVAVTNDIYRASNVKIELNALRIDKVDYPQHYSSQEALQHATGQGSNHMFLSHERQIRDAIGADTMILLRPDVHDGTCGRAWLNSNFSNNTYMVSHTSIDCSDDTNAHELGHNMGLSHSRRQGDIGATYPFALGHGVDGSFTTVMAYPSAFSGASRMYKYASPTLDCNGYPCGVDKTDQVNGADAVYALNQKRFEIAAVAARKPTYGSLNVQVEGVENATITSSTDHGGTAPYSLPEVTLGTQVILLAPATVNNIAFNAWIGCDSVSDLQCNVVIRGDTQVTALFNNATDSFSDVVEAPQLEFNSSGDSPWRIDYATAAAGGSSLRSSIISDSQTSVIETTLEGAGTLRFSWKVSSEQHYDFLRLYVNGSRYTEISGDINWYEASVTLQQGSHQIRWVYEKDNGSSSGADAGWIDNVKWEASTGTQQLTVSKSGLGRGTIISGPELAVCDEQCNSLTSPVAPSTWIYISASPDQQSEFAGWTGACSGQTDFCQLFVNQNITTTAVFNSIAPPGNDNFTSAYPIEDISGRTIANNRYATAESNNPVVPTASGKTLWWQWTAPKSGLASINTFNSNFNTVLAVYSGSSFNDLNLVALNDDAAQSVNSAVNFSMLAGVNYYVLVDGISGGAGDIELYWDLQRLPELTINISGNGAGTVQLPPYENCSTVSCLYQVSVGEVITLTAQPHSGSEFSSWSGDCGDTSTAICQLTMTENNNVTANFILKQYELSSTVTDGGVIRTAPDFVLHGQPAVFQLSPATGYRVNRVVGGTCPPGQWLNAVTYQTGAATAACSVIFSFIEYQRSKKIPLWLLVSPRN